MIPQKVGYWVYHYHFITSLPDEPTFQSFEKLTAIDRDTIASVFYKVPKDFNPSLKELQEKGGDVFNNLNIKKLEIDTTEGENLYIRKNPLLFEATSSIIVSTLSNANGSYSKYSRYVYNVDPTGVIMRITDYAEEAGINPYNVQSSKFIKRAMIH